MSVRPGGRGGPGVDPKRVSGELFNLTYGALVAQILRDYENVDDVNKQLDKMGYNIGVRLVEDFLSRQPGGGQRCGDLRETADKIQQAFKVRLHNIAQLGLNLFYVLLP